MKKVYIWGAPSDNLRGGAEMLVYLAFSLKSLGREVKMFNFSSDCYKIADTFVNYYGELDTCGVEEVLMTENSIVVLPELLIQDLRCFDFIKEISSKNIVMIWMLSTGFTGAINSTWGIIFNEFRYNQNVYFLCESRYAYELLSFYEINENKFMLQHGTHDIFLQAPITCEKKKQVFYNGYKDKNRFFVEQMLMPVCEGIKFTGCLPENGFLSKESIIRLMDESMVYVDFCEFYGRELMPREAALRRCVLLLNDNGCAKYYEDYPIPSWYKIKTNDAKVVAEKIRHIFANYDSSAADMHFMQKKCEIEKSVFIENLKKIF